MGDLCPVGRYTLTCLTSATNCNSFVGVMTGISIIIIPAEWRPLLFIFLPQDICPVGSWHYNLVIGPPCRGPIHAAPPGMWSWLDHHCWNKATGLLVKWLETLTATPEVVGSIPTQDKYLCDEHCICSVSGCNVSILCMYLKHLSMYISCLVW